MRTTVALLALGAVSFAAEPPVHRNGRFEKTFEVVEEYFNPLTATPVEVEFRGPQGRRETVSAFWDGGRTWRVRFRPEHSGLWEYRVSSREPELDNERGEFRVRDYAGPNRLHRLGSPKLSPNRRHFVHTAGAPWFFLSDTAWNGALMSTPEEWDKYLKDRAAKKFTAVQFVMTQWRAGRHDERGQVAFAGTDSIAINPAFFQRMDEKFDALNTHGLVAVPVLLWALTSKEKESPGESLSDEQASLLARYMVTRYAAHHVIWFLGGDGDYRGEKAARWKKIGREVFPAGRRYGPVTLHPRGMQSPWAEFKEEAWLDFFLYQSGHGNDARKWRWNATQGGATDWKMEPPRPVIDGEPNYEAHLDYHTRQPVTDYQVRRAAYYSLLAAPPAGISYGAHGVWFWSRKAEVPLDHPRTGVAQPWWECLDYQGARQMKVLRDIFDSIQWWKLRPDRSLLVEDIEDAEFKTHMMPARSESGEFALIYLPANRSVKLNLEKFAGTVKAAWINPRTGRRTDAGPLRPQPSIELKTPGEGDWLLLLSR